MFRLIKLALLTALIALLGVQSFAQTSQLFVADSRVGILRFDGNTGNFLNQFVKPGIGGMSDPIGITVGPDGNLYVASAGSNSVLRFNGISGKFIDAFVPSNTAGLEGAFGLTFGPNGNLYVASPYRHSVYQFNGSSGAFIDSYGVPAPNGSQYLHGIAFGPDENYYVANSNSEVHRFNGATGAFMDTFLSSSAISSDSGLAFGPDGNLYVCSYYTGSVERFNGKTGAFIDHFVPNQSGGLAKPEGIAFGPDKNLYVSSYGTGQVLKYNGKTGAFLGVFAQTSSMSYPVYIAFKPSVIFPIGVRILPQNIYGSTQATGRVVLNLPAVTDTTVVLTNTNTAATVPSSVLIPAGQTIGVFAISTVKVDSSQKGKITATSNGVLQQANITVRPAGIATITIQPTTVVGGASSKGTITLEGVLPTDTVVTLISSNPAAAKPTASNVTIPANTTSTTFDIVTTPVPYVKAVLFTATLNGTSKNATLKVLPASLSKITLSAAKIDGGSTVQATVSLTGIAMPGGIKVITTASSALASVPVSVLIPEGESSISFDVKTSDTANDTNVDISASYGSVSKSAHLTVLGARPIALSFDPATIKGGESTTGTVILTRTVGVDTTVMLTSANTAATVPASVVVPAGAYSVTFPITTTAVTVKIKGKITATLNTKSVATSLIVTP
ncbi:MAG: NHL repeat-containing protein [Armatimonadetes bacterium]|nr:NHL repeat-containing protein [Armatimonadota bacterium]